MTAKASLGHDVIGTCGLCGGRVSVPSIWFGVHAPTPTCEHCGAVAAAPRLPVIPMTPKPDPNITLVPGSNIANTGMASQKWPPPGESK